MPSASPRRADRSSGRLKSVSGASYHWTPKACRERITCLSIAISCSTVSVPRTQSHPDWATDIVDVFEQIDRLKPPDGIHAVKARERRWSAHAMEQTVSADAALNHRHACRLVRSEPPPGGRPPLDALTEKRRLSVIESPVSRDYRCFRHNIDLRDEAALVDQSDIRQHRPEA